MLVLIVGLGSIAKKHIAALRSLYPPVSITALRSHNTGTSVEGVQTIHDWNDVVFSPDFVIISNPTQLHKEAIGRALQLNCPLFIEKPMVKDVSELNELLSQTNIKECFTYVACNLRFHPCVIFLRELLTKETSKINEVNVYCGSDLSKWRPEQNYTESYSASSLLGGGVHLDLIHEIDYCYWLFGKPDEVVSLKRKVSQLKINSPDFAAYHLLYPFFTINITLNYYRQDVKRGIEIVMENKTLYADLVKAEVWENGNLIYTVEGFKMENTYIDQMKYFIDHIKMQQPMMNNVEEAAEVLKIAIA